MPAQLFDPGVRRRAEARVHMSAEMRTTDLTRVAETRFRVESFARIADNGTARRPFGTDHFAGTATGSVLFWFRRHVHAATAPTRAKSAGRGSSRHHS